MEVAERALCLHFIGYALCSCCFISILCLEAGVVLGFCHKVSENTDLPLYKGKRRKTSPFLPFSGCLMVDPEVLHALWT